MLYEMGLFVFLLLSLYSWFSMKSAYEKNETFLEGDVER